MKQQLMFEKILVANRGEIAVRIMRSAQELGIKTVAIYEETDKDAFHITQGDEAICVGPGPRKDYLNIEGIIEAARKTGAQAIHPGYGFLAENPDFSKACTDAGLVFIGPPPEVIRNLGSKVIARQIAVDAGIPVIPATENLSPGGQGEEKDKMFAQLWKLIEPKVFELDGPSGEKGDPQENVADAAQREKMTSNPDEKGKFDDRPGVLYPPPK